MATLPGQRAQVTWALNQYNQADDAETRTEFVRAMAKVIADAPKNGFTVEQVTKGQNYPVVEVNQYIDDAGRLVAPELSEEQAQKQIEAGVDTAEAMRVGTGSAAVYAYGYHCCPDRLKIGSTEVDTVQRIYSQRNESTPDKPVLQLEIKTDQCRVLERAIQSVLRMRGRKIEGGGAEWFTVSRDEILTIYEFIKQR